MLHSFNLKKTSATTFFHSIGKHKNLQNDLALMGDLFASYMVEEEILEHNLYGVDINEDAVEIAKLSLWLRTAKRGRPLTKLVDKIKCGNSLIDDKNVVANAFVWEEEFKEVRSIYDLKPTK